MSIDAESLRRRFSAELETNSRAKVCASPTGEFRRASEPAVHFLNPPVGNHPLRAHPVKTAADESNENDSSGSYYSSHSAMKET